MTQVQRYLLVVYVSLFVFVGASIQPAHSGLANIDNNLKSTVLVSIKNVKPLLDETTNNTAPVPMPESGGLGSGIIVSPQGHIITNYHVIEKGNTISVWMHDDKSMTEYEATIVGYDKLSDIAVIKIDLPEDYIFRYIEWGKEPDFGDDIYVIGHPQGMIWSVSKGVVSNPKRFVSSPWQRLIQSDALIMPGNSGGPLFDNKGNLIGINTLMILSRDPNAKTQAWAMSIHVDDVRWVYDRIISYGEVRRPALNIEVDFDVDKKLVKIKASPDSNLYKAGMIEESYLSEIDGVKVQEYGDIFKYLKTKLDGDAVTVKVVTIESGEVLTLEFVLGSWKDMEEKMSQPVEMEVEPKEKEDTPMRIPPPK